MISLRRTIAAIPLAREVRGLLISAAVRSGAVRLRRVLSRRRHVILTFHRVRAAGEPADPFDTCPSVPVEVFRQILLHMKQHFDILPLRELCSSRRLARPSAAITFDDGWRDNYDVAFPILQELGLPATVFVTTGKIGSSVPFWQQLLGRKFRAAAESPQDQADCRLREALGLGPRAPLTPDVYRDAVVRLKKLPCRDREECLLRIECNGHCGAQGERHFLSAAEIREMAAAGIDFGSHTVTHAILPQLPPAEVERELTESKAALEGILGTPVDMLAYPDGQYSEVVFQTARTAGYRIGCTTRFGRLPQTAVLDAMDVPRLDADSIYPCGSDFDSSRFAWHLW